MQPSVLPLAAQNALRLKMLPARLVGKELSANGRLGYFRVAMESGPVPAFAAGQYITVGLETPAGFVPRAYSLASCPFDRDAYELYIVRVDDGRLTPHLFETTVGTPLRLMPPKGHFTLDRAGQRSVVMVATGTGLAPFVSQVRSLHRLHLAGIPTDHRVILMHGAAHADEFGYLDELAGYAAQRGGGFDFTYLCTASRPDPARGWSSRFGGGRVNQLFRHVFGLPETATRPTSLPDGIDAAHLRELVQPGRTALMVCGNPGMIEDLREPAAQLGIAKVLVEEYWKA